MGSPVRVEYAPPAMSSDPSDAMDSVEPAKSTVSNAAALKTVDAEATRPHRAMQVSASDDVAGSLGADSSSRDESAGGQA